MSQLAENRRTTIKAQIKRSSARARASMNRLDRERLDQLDRIYREASADLQAAIRSYAGSDGSVRLEVLRDLLGQAEQRLGQLAEARDRLIEDGLVDAAQIGVRPFQGVAGVAAALTAIPEDAVRFAQNFVGEDGLQLSDRIWRLDRGARESVSRAIESAVIQGHSASRAATDFLSRGQAVPGDIAAKIGAAGADRIATAAGSALLTSEDNPRFHALRVLRTEMNRAHGEAYRAAAFSHPDVIGTRFLLSPNHPAPDICDMHAHVNRYGLGPGVYPQGKSPWPAHPNTLSYEEVVFADEVTSEDRAGQQDRIEWLKAQPPGRQEAVLGSRKKRAALEQGLLRENEIATPWQALKARYIRRGVDVDALLPAHATPKAITGPAAGLRRIAPEAPVSDALEVEAERAAARRALDAIDSVHGDGALPVIPVRSADARRQALGYYTSDSQNNPVGIFIRAAGDHKELTVCHEIGHFLDQQGIPGDGWSSERHPLLSAWRRAVDQTAPIRQLKKLQNGPQFIPLTNGGRHEVAKGYVRYLLDRAETWARSYTQWIALRSGDGTIRRQLTSIVARERGNAVDYLSHWTDEEFEPVAQAIDELMETLGWR